MFFLLGGLIVYALVYVFGFLVLRYDWLFLWYMLNMFSAQMITFPTAAVAMGMIAAGLAMIVDPPGASRQVTASAAAPNPQE